MFLPHHIGPLGSHLNYSFAVSISLTFGLLWRHSWNSPCTPSSGAWILFLQSLWVLCVGLELLDFINYNVVTSMALQHFLYEVIELIIRGELIHMPGLTPQDMSRIHILIITSDCVIRRTMLAWP